MLHAKACFLPITDTAKVARQMIGSSHAEILRSTSSASFGPFTHRFPHVVASLCSVVRQLLSKTGGARLVVQSSAE